MKPVGLLCALVALLVAGSAFAHDIPQSTVQLDIGLQAVVAEVRLPLSELGAALQLPLAESPVAATNKFAVVIREYIQRHAKLTTSAGAVLSPRIESISSWRSSNRNYLSNDWLVVNLRYEFPMGTSTSTFRIDYDVIVSRLVTHNILVSVRRDLRNGLTGETPQLLDMLGFQHTHIVVDGSSGSWLKGFRRMFAHGAAHIAAGTDHLLFLLVLLLPAPLIAKAGCWAQPRRTGESAWMIVKTVSGFTIGHSITLAFAGLGWIAAPSRPVEILIALSILVSALHAWRPMFSGREPWIACGFGSVHGLAFANSIDGLGFDTWTFAVSVFGFNLGIEAVQLAIVVLLLPIMLWAVRYRVYLVARSALAAFAAVCALGWLGERAFGAVNPFANVVDWLAGPPLWFVAIWCALAVLALLAMRRKPAPSAPVGLR